MWNYVKMYMFDCFYSIMHERLHAEVSTYMILLIWEVSEVIVKWIINGNT